jgi:hypothetical protein
VQPSPPPQESYVSGLEYDEDFGIEEGVSGLGDLQFDHGAPQPAHRRASAKQGQPTLQPPQKGVSLAEVPLNTEGEPRHNEEYHGDGNR